MRDVKPANVPLAPDEIAAASAQRDLQVPAACAEGVAANLQLLERHLKVLRAAATGERAA